MSTFQDLLTLTRGSTATYYNRFGLIATAAIDSPRFQHDPATVTTSSTTINLDALSVGDSVLIDLPGSDTFAVGKDISVTDSSNINRYLTAVVEFSNPGSVQVTVKTINGTGSGSSWTLIENLGLLIEEQRTNLLLWSEDFSQAAWAKSSATVSSSSETAPDGSGTMQLANVADSGSIQQVKTLQAGVSYAVSGYAKKATSSFIIVGVSVDCELRLDFDSKTLTEELPGNNVRNLKVRELPNGVLAWSAVFDSSVSGWRGERPAASKPGLGALDAYIWGAQLEQASNPSSYIPTTSAQVTRTEDNCSRTLGAEFNGINGDWTVFCEYRCYPILGINQRLISFNSAGSNTGEFFINGSGVDGNPAANFNKQTFTAINLDPSQGVRVAVSKSQSEFIVVANGIHLGTDTTFSPSSVESQGMFIGRAGGPFNTLNGEVKNIQYFPRALTQSELEALTA